VSGPAVMAVPEKNRSKGGKAGKSAEGGVPPSGPGDLPGGSPPPPPEKLGAVTKVGAYEYQRDLIRKIGSHLGLNQEDTLLRYLRVMREDLLRLMAIEQAELEGRHPDNHE
jgi:hypothetical protein